LSIFIIAIKLFVLYLLKFRHYYRVHCLLVDYLAIQELMLKTLGLSNQTLTLLLYYNHLKMLNELAVLVSQYSFRLIDPNYID